MNHVHTVLLSVAIVEDIELIWVCGWRVDLFFVLLKMGDNDTPNM